ncbi:MAG: YebC/PmpR family DNA-binding transcriptional regulator [Candidatus Latescibacterota bacterium]|nr:MAG: YebC/PmpR family DNA-binding transcriptional regulator [Candidatus Latescibacterota bacterium]
MSGHSKWATIRRKKGKIDAERGRIFTRLIREITIAARSGGGDPGGNPRLRTAIDTARASNMPAANIDRAVKKGTGDLPGQIIEEVAYEAYAPGGVALLIETVTDNRNRTASEVRHLLTKYGGRMGEVGSVSWMFAQKGLIVVTKGSLSEEDVMMAALDAGAEDVSDEGDSWEITTGPSDLAKVNAALRDAGIAAASAAISRLPKSTVAVGRDMAGRVLKLVEVLEEQDDVQQVSANFDIPDEILEELGSSEE